MQKIRSQGLPTNFNTVKETWQSVSLMLNAGIDMFMIPGYRGLIGVRDVVNGLK